MKTKSVLLIGLGRFGKYIAMKLHELGHEIMAVDDNEERINDAMPYVTNGQIGDSTNETLLKSLGVKNYDVCIVTIGGDFQSSLETTCLLKNWERKRLCRARNRTFRQNFFCVTVRTKLFIPKNNLPHGRQFGIVPTIFWII